MAKTRKTAKKASRRTTPMRGAARRRPSAPSVRGFDAVVAQLSEITRTLRTQQEAIEQLVALQEALRHDRALPAEPSETIGSIPRISLVPPRAA